MLGTVLNLAKWGMRQPSPYMMLAINTVAMATSTIILYYFEPISYV